MMGFLFEKLFFWEKKIDWTIIVNASLHEITLAL